MGKRELVALLCLSSWCLVIVVWLFLTMPRVYLQFVMVVFPHHTRLLFSKVFWSADAWCCWLPTFSALSTDVETTYGVKFSPVCLYCHLWWWTPTYSDYFYFATWLPSSWRHPFIWNLMCESVTTNVSLSLTHANLFFLYAHVCFVVVCSFLQHILTNAHLTQPVHWSFFVSSLHVPILVKLLLIYILCFFFVFFFCCCFWPSIYTHIC